MKIVERLVSEINTGIYKPNDKLPSENTLADVYRLPRITVRKAYERLQDLGYVYSKQGKGSYVKGKRKQIPLILSGEASFSEKMIEKGYDFQSKNIFCERIDYDNKIFEFLNMKNNDVVCKIGRLRFVDQKPIALHISYVALIVFNEIDKDGSQISSMFDYYKRKGYTDFMTTSSVLSISFPTESERKILDTTCLVPLLVLETGTKDKKTGTVLEYTKILYRSDSFSYVLP